MIDYRAARLNMVESQLRTNKVTDEAVLDAFLDVPRERFVPPHLAGIAYVDDDIPLGGGRWMLEPMVLARLLQLAAIGPDDGVLEIGAANGLCDGAPGAAGGAGRRRRERPAPHRHRARADAGDAERQCHAARGPLEEGYPAGAPYEVIVIGGAVARFPMPSCASSPRAAGWSPC